MGEKFVQSFPADYCTTVRDRCYLTVGGFAVTDPCNCTKQLLLNIFPFVVPSKLSKTKRHRYKAVSAVWNSDVRVELRLAVSTRDEWVNMPVCGCVLACPCNG